MLLPVSIRHNSRGDHVREIQSLLNRNGAQLTVDGMFGPKTDAAVRAFQSQRQLAVDGIVGSKTWAALSGSSGGSSIPLPVSIRRNSRGDHVRQIQTLLNRHGAQLATDGVFGPRTDAAVRTFQSQRGLAVDGIVGPMTWATLNGNGGPPPPPSHPATVQGILDRARGEMGNHEHPPGSNRTKYGAWYGLDGNPWCAMFVSWVFYHEGMPLPFTIDKGFAYTPSGVAGFRARGQWHTSGPRPGDVVFFNWDGGRVDHVGIVESVNGDGSIYTIEGNTSNNIVERRHRKSMIAGYGRPHYR